MLKKGATIAYIIQRRVARFDYQLHTHTHTHTMAIYYC